MNRIKKLREEKGLTQSQIAIKIGTSQAAVALWETKDYMPQADKLPELARILNCTIDDLFNTKGEE